MRRPILHGPLEKIAYALLIGATLATVLITTLLLVTLFWESWLFFESVPLLDFILGLEWNPRITEAGLPEGFGVIPLLTGTLLITTIALSLAVPVGLMSAIYLSEYASPTVRNILKPTLEMLAGIPTVVYGFFAALVIAPLLRDAGIYFHMDVGSESAINAGLVMGIMIIPLVSSLTEDVLYSVSDSLRYASLAMGATRSETIKKVILPAAAPGIIAAFLLALSRAIGETMIVVMAAGLVAQLTFNPFESVTTLTVQMVTLLTGDQEFDNPKSLSAYALGLTLFILTFAINLAAARVVNYYRKKYG